MSARPVDDEKTCAVCGRRFAWRARWARDWASVRHCSQRCRRHGLGPLDAALETAIREHVAARAARGATLCPSEVARKVAGACGEEWRDLLERTRMAARRLADAGEIEILQRGRRVDPTTVRGPIRLRRGR